MESRWHIQCFIHSSVGVISVCLERKSSLRCYRIYASSRLFTQLPTNVFHYEHSRTKTIVDLAQTHHLPRHPSPPSPEPQPTRQRSRKTPPRCCFQTMLTFMWVDVHFKHLKINAAAEKQSAQSLLTVSTVTESCFFGGAALHLHTMTSVIASKSQQHLRLNYFWSIVH